MPSSSHCVSGLPHLGQGGSKKSRLNLQKNSGEKVLRPPLSSVRAESLMSPESDRDRYTSKAFCHKDAIRLLVNGSRELGAT